MRIGYLIGWFFLLLALGVASSCTDGREAAPKARVKPDCTAPAVKTSSGTVCGLELRVSGRDREAAKPTYAYLGVPYGQSTAGDRRWAPPVAVTAGTGRRKATVFGPICPQSETWAKGRVQSEDCLSLNVWTPVRPGGPRGQKRPVMVYIHGGAFVLGASDNPLYDGRRIAATGRVVVVSLNYRLGALGFLAGAEGLSGNYGLLDQRLALQWVQKNIGRFGGDPKRVTIFGESAGAMSVGLHLVSPGSRGLFRAAIMQSNPYGIPYKTVREARTFGIVLRDRLGCADGGVPCMRARTFRDVVRHQTSTTLTIEGALSGFGGFLAWAPVIDGQLVPGQPVNMAITKPAIIGTNRDEGEVFVAPEQIQWFGGKKEIPRFEYRIELFAMFPAKVARRIVTFDRYKPQDGDNTEVLARLVTDYIFTCPNRHVMAAARAPVYGYQFTKLPSYPVWPEIKLCEPARAKVCHGFEVPYVFQNPKTVSVQQPPVSHRFTPSEVSLSRTMAAYWTRFASTLNPNRKGVPRWPRFRTSDPARLVFDTPLAKKSNLLANCPFWDSVGYDLPGLLRRLSLTTRR